MKTQHTTARREKFKHKHPYVHAKTKSSKIKSSKKYVKVYRGQGRH